MVEYDDALAQKSPTMALDLEGSSLREGKGREGKGRERMGWYG